MGYESRFSRCHPAVTFLFFVAAIVGSMVFLHPVYLAVSVVCAMALLYSQQGRKALPLLLGMVPLFLGLTVLNPLFNPAGDHVLFTYWGRSYTFEALVYGAIVGGMLVSALLWFSSYNAVMTSDKFTCLFGNLIPALSLILVMVLRLIPSYQRKASQISGARRCVGKSPASTNDWREKADDGIMVLSSLTTWALEGAIVTADSMRSRGYGVSKRSSFQVYRWQVTDVLLLGAILILGAVTVTGSALGWTAADFIPGIDIAPVTGLPALGIASYIVLLLIPTILNTLEAIKWNSFRSRI